MYLDSYTLSLIPFMTMPTIQVKNLKKHFGKTKAVDGISFDINKGEIMGFLGPNGAGKTTTIRCLMDFLRPDSGSIEILGLDAQGDSEELKNDIGFLSGEVKFYDNWTGREHIDFIKRIRNSKIDEQDLISKLDFDPSKRARNLSTGNKQKLGLILALMHKPKVLILDEPTTGLDPLLQDAIYDILKAEAKDGATIFFSSHNLAEVERICDRVLILRKGKIVDKESIAELKVKRMYTVYVYFEDEIPRKQLETNGMKIAKDLGDGVVLNVTGDIRPLLRKLDDFKIKDLEITHSNLEDIFLKFYK